MKKTLSRTEAENKINEFFDDINEKDTKGLKKIKRLSMSYKIKLGNKRKLFCKKCLNALKGKTRINKKFKSVICKFCNYKNKFKLS